MSSIYPLIGEFSLAVQAGTEALEIARGEDDRQGIRMALFGLALTRYRLEETAAARSCAEEGLAICRQIGDTFFTSYFLWILALAATEIGEIEVARGAADEALELAELLEVPLLLVCALEASAAVARAEGDDRLAWDRLQRADEIARGGMVPSSYSATVARSLGEIARSRGDEATADELLGRSLTISQAVHDVWGVERSRAAMTHGGGA